jgi:cytochrome c peroxidase
VKRSVSCLVVALAAFACGDKKKPDGGAPPSPAPSASAAPYDITQLAAFAPLPASFDHPSNPPNEEKIALGRTLFFDARLSAGRDVSCATCHDPSKAGDDGKPVAVGTKGEKAKRNTPTIFGAAGAHAQGWAARASTVEEMIAVHATDAWSLGTDEKRLVAFLGATPAYQAAFRKAFAAEKTPISMDTFAKAIGAWVRRLVTPSRWDKFLSGDTAALSDEEKRGLGAFMDAGCPACHAGKYVGGAQNQKLGVARPWPPPGNEDPGRFEVTKQPADRGVFKVPSLRNVTKTAPYLHDGSVATLEEATRLMARHQAGRDVTEAQAKSIVVFLGALAGEPPKDLVTPPSP